MTATSPAEPAPAARWVAPAPPGLAGRGKALAVVFWTAFLITVLVLAASGAVASSSQLLSSWCGDGCDSGYRLDSTLGRAALIGQPLLAGAALVAWSMARRPPRTGGHRLYGVAVVAQLALLGWVLFETYRLFVA